MQQLSRKIILCLLLCLVILPSACFGAESTAITEGINIIKKPLGLSDFNIIVFIAKIINVGLGLIGIVMVSMIILMGFQYMIAMGDEEASAKLRQSFLNLIVGVTIIFSSYSIAQFVFNTVLKAT